MEIKLEINNLAKSPVADSFLRSVAKEVFQEIGSDFLAGKEITVSLAWVSPEEIRRINRENRKIDQATDVLSFAEFEKPDEIEASSEKELFLGEIILCYDDIEKYAEKEHISLDQELANVVSHGFLHLLGFDHGPEMFSIQDRVRGKF